MNLLQKIHLNSNVLVPLSDATDAGVFEGYLAVYDKPTRDGRKLIIAKGAFSHQINAINSGEIILPICLSHNENDTAGRWEYLEDREFGLWARGRLVIDSKSVSNEIYPKLKAGAYGGISVGFITEEYDSPTKSNANYVVKKARLLEASLVPIPAFSDAKITRANAQFDEFNAQDFVELAFAPKGGILKGKITTLKEFERGLRDVCALSKSQAAKVVFELKQDERYANIERLFDLAPKQNEQQDESIQLRLAALSHKLG